MSISAGEQSSKGRKNISRIIKLTVSASKHEKLSAEGSRFLETGVRETERRRYSEVLRTTLLYNGGY